MLLYMKTIKWKKEKNISVSKKKMKLCMFRLTQ